ncbi:MAG: sigma-54 dependent transcriptional regulator [Bdellovibrionales bacterium]
MSSHVKAKILVVDDEKAIREIISASLEDDGFEVHVAQDGVSGLAQIKRVNPQIVLLDIWMPGELDGIDVLKKAKAEFPGIEFIIMSGHGTIETAVRATKLGAWDFVEKPLSIDKISILISNILSYQSERLQKNALLTKLRTDITMVGDSDKMVQLKQMVTRVAPTESWVLITGENGTGKELVAQNIHYLSRRASSPFIEVNCAAIPSELIEAELFGFEKGAFTGATQGKKGKFDQANGGTLLLDEIGDMSLDAQSKILRILQERNFTRVGGTEKIDVDVRVIAATNKNLEEEIKAGHFREDLYYRLNVIPFVVPSLRSRLEDIPALIRHFGNQFCKNGGHRPKVFADKALEKLQKYSWPGNVRELRNFVERIYILTPGDYVEVPDLRFAGLSFDNAEGSDGEFELNFREARARFERDFLIRMIDENDGNITKTAEKIGLERSYLHRKIKSYGLDL